MTGISIILTCLNGMVINVYFFKIDIFSKIAALSKLLFFFKFTISADEFCTTAVFSFVNSHLSSFSTSVLCC